MCYNMFEPHSITQLPYREYHIFMNVGMAKAWTFSCQKIDNSGEFMKKLCFASIFNILVLAAKDTISQIKIYNSICESIDPERTVCYDDTTISKIKKGSRPGRT